MDEYANLGRQLRNLIPRNIPVYQGIVKSVEGTTCTVTCGNIDIPDVRLMASRQADGGLLLIPETGSAVTVGSLSGGLDQLVVIAFSRIKSVSVSGTVKLNAGSNGGLINIMALTDKLNELVAAFNAHVHPANGSPPAKSAKTFNKVDYEDAKVTH